MNEIGKLDSSVIAAGELAAVLSPEQVMEVNSLGAVASGARRVGEPGPRL